MNRKTKRVCPVAGKLSLTKQSFKDECDINFIMRKYQKTGLINHLNKHGPQYGFATSEDLRESLQIVKDAQEMFDDLPSTIRRKFGGDPAEFLDFVQNPENLQEMGLMGLLDNPPKPPHVPLGSILATTISTTPAPPIKPLS